MRACTRCGEVMTYHTPYSFDSGANAARPRSHHISTYVLVRARSAVLAHGDHYYPRGEKSAPLLHSRQISLTHSYRVGPTRIDAGDFTWVDAPERLEASNQPQKSMTFIRMEAKKCLSLIKSDFTHEHIIQYTENCISSDTGGLVRCCTSTAACSLMTRTILQGSCR